HGYNLEDDGGATCGFSAGTNDKVGQAANLAAPNNNGGLVLTQLPNGGSPLINAIPSPSCQFNGASGVTTDARGVSRPQQGACDIGAVEVGVTATPTPTSTPVPTQTPGGSTATPTATPTATTVPTA